MFKTVKFRITILYIVIFAAAALLVFTMLYSRLRKSMTQAVDRDLINLVLKLEDRYISGEGVDDDEELIPLEQVDPQVIKTVTERMKGFTTRLVRQEIEDGNKVYEVIGYWDGMHYEVKVENQKIVDIESNSVYEHGEECANEFMKNVIVDEVSYMGGKRASATIYKPTGDLLVSSLAQVNQLPKPDINLPMGFEGFQTSRTKVGKVRLLTKRLLDGAIIQATISTREKDKLLQSYRALCISIFIPLLLFGSIAGWLVAGRAMRGVNRVREIAEKISHGDLNSRVPIGNEGSEISGLAFTFNEMVNRLQLLIKEVKEVSDNIAHDLRTPVTRIRGIIETTVSNQPNTTEMMEMSGDVVEECDHLIQMINTMLEITRTESGLQELNIGECDLSELLHNAYELFQLSAESKGLSLTLNLPRHKCVTRVDKNRIQRVVANLLDNAIKYTDKGSTTVTLKELNQDFVVTFSDTGRGISNEDLTHIFDRFYRCDSSRSLPGNGLGLSLAKSIAKAHGGDITAHSSANGTVFTLTIPV